MQRSIAGERDRWVVHCDPLTIAAVKALAASKKQSVGKTLDQAVEYFSRKVRIDPNRRLNWELPDDF